MSGNGYYGRDMRGGPGYRPPPPHLEYRRHPPFDGIPPDRCKSITDVNITGYSQLLPFLLFFSGIITICYNNLFFNS